MDARGAAVSEAVVNLEIEQGARALLEASMSLSAETARDGRFELPALPGAVTLRASRGMAQGLAQATAGDKPTDVVIRLDDPVTVRGVVVDAEGNGVQGASITALSTLAAGGINEKHRFETNAIGQFELTMPAGHIRLEARGGSKRTAPWVELLTSGQRREDVKLTLVDDQIVRGKVTTPDGTPVSGAEIRLIAASSYNAITGSDGSFEVAVPEVVSYLVKVKHSAGNIQRRIDAWNVDAGESFTLLPFGSLEVKAQNAGGDVTVAIDSFVPADGSGPRAPAEASYKGPAGGVVVPMIEPGTYDFTVSSPGMKPVAMRGVVVGSGPAVLPVAFEKLGAAWVAPRSSGSTGRARPC
ncbi:MAG TPA: carboxypeptidase-like regulatory domain-containing protein [Kofleriaceae bacterium]|nr:carboxypeptidase-like regulatory domain-containing protein [Kofleriaceae bacterium]